MIASNEIDLFSLRKHFGIYTDVLIFEIYLM